MQRASKKVFVETDFSGCNVGLVNTSEGIVLIDTPTLPSDAVRWRETVASMGKVKYLINTEPHIDHIFGNSFFKEATVVGHEGIRKRFPVTREDWSGAYARTQNEDPEGMSLVQDYVSHPPTLTYRDTYDLAVGDTTFQLINLPGHSKEQTAIVIQGERVVFTGDNVVTHNNPWLHEADPWVLLESLEKIAALDVDVIVPGHGNTCGKERVPEMAALVREWISAVQGAMDRGVSREEARKTISFLDRYPVEPARLEQTIKVQQMNVANIWDRLVARGHGRQSHSTVGES